MNPRHFFFAPVVLSRYNHRNNTTFPVNAASNKVMGMVAGVRSQASPSLIVSSPIVTASRDRRYFCGFVCRDQQLACAYLPAISVRGLNRVFAAFVYLGFAVRRIQRGDGVVFYNYFPEYVPVAVFLSWRLGRDKIVMDLEDGPRADEKNLRGYMNRFSLRLMSRVCSPRAIVVSSQLADLMKIDDACVVNGVSPDIAPQRPAFGARVTFLYGGTIDADTGLDLFASALRTLARTRPELAARAHFVVTGFGGGEQLAALARELAPTGFTLDVRQDAGPDEYKQILARADVGLSLKLPHSTLNATTFPSKVIEFASHGLLVLSTEISDIPLLFDRHTAAILPDAQASTLANLLAAITVDPKRYAQIAAAGQRKIVERCSRRSVGRRLVEFLNGTAEASKR